MKPVIVIIALLLPVSLQAASLTTSVPARFIGDWAASPQSCDSGTDDLTLRIASNRIRYWESEGPIKAVVVRGNAEIALITELSGEGETWLATATFKLSKDGRKLVEVSTVPGQEIVRYKCPK